MYASMYAYTNTNVVYWFWWSSYFIKYIYRLRLRIYNFRCILYIHVPVLTILFFILCRFDIWPAAKGWFWVGRSFFVVPRRAAGVFHRHSFCWSLGGQMFGDYCAYTGSFLLLFVFGCGCIWMMICWWWWWCWCWWWDHDKFWGWWGGCRRWW